MRRCRSGFAAVILFSLAINLLMLTGPLYMLQIFDRVLTSRSVETLIYLSLIAGFAFVILLGLDIVRGLVMVSLGTWLDRRVGGDALAASLNLSLAQRRASVQGVQDLGTVRAFLTSPGIFPILDAPWTPLYLAVLFVLHPSLGWMGLVGALVLFNFGLAHELLTRRSLMRASNVSSKALEEAQAAARNADAIHAMGMLPNLTGRWGRTIETSLVEQARASRRGGIITSYSKFIRQLLGVGILGFGAWLMLQNELTPGGMIAASILMARALAPVEQAITLWRSAIACRTSYRHLKRLLSVAAPHAPAPPLPAPSGILSVEDVTYAHLSQKQPILRNIRFKLAAGESLGLIGPTAVGKTTLARILIGNLKPQLGHARLDGADVADWDPRDRGQYIGYLPQDVELFSGTVRENIARLAIGEPEQVFAAAKIAGIHQEILSLQNGYETEIGAGGMALSGGQRQKIALARALYGNPRLVVLDEPNSNLDMAGESGLFEALAHLKACGATVVIIAHRPSVLRAIDKILVLRDGTIEMMGSRDEVFARVTGPRASSMSVAKVT